MKRILVFFLFACLSLAGMFVYQYFHFHDGKLHLIFCNVGQGDGILITTPNNKHILVDSGPDDKIFSCLSRHMGFWERTINLAILTHPHADHLNGFGLVIERYNVEAFATENLSNNTAGFQNLVHLLNEKHIPRKIIASGDQLKTGETSIRIIAPTEEFLRQKSPGRSINDSSEFASLITEISYGKFHALLTGDSQAEEMKQAVDVIDGQIDVLQVPHHGSATGLREDFITDVHPQLAVISVGRLNRYRHPNALILFLLKQNNIPFLRTDQSGDVEIVSDGKRWEVRT